MDYQLQQTLRGMAWERAKGELQSALHTFHTPPDKVSTFEAFDELIEEFVTKVEDEGLHE